MPPIKSTTSLHYDALIVLILFTGEIMPFCSCCTEKGLIYVAIMSPSGCQPSSCTECTKANMRSLYNICFASDSEYTCPICL